MSLIAVQPSAYPVATSSPLEKERVARFRGVILKQRVVMFFRLSLVVMTQRVFQGHRRRTRSASL